MYLVTHNFYHFYIFIKINKNKKCNINYTLIISKHTHNLFYLYLIFIKNFEV